MMDRALRILVVDDEPDILETLEYSLAKKGYEVATALDGLEGLDKAKRLPPDFMILDVMLPGCNGYEVSRMLKEWMENDPEAKSFPIMLLTARKVDSHDREKFIATWSRADACIYKPFELEEVVNTITELTQKAAS
jgi:DNA-binding response OmpR family regulator